MATVCDKYPVVCRKYPSRKGQGAYRFPIALAGGDCTGSSGTTSRGWAGTNFRLGSSTGSSSEGCIDGVAVGASISARWSSVNSDMCLGLSTSEIGILQTCMDSLIVIVEVL